MKKKTQIVLGLVTFLVFLSSVNFINRNNDLATFSKNINIIDINTSQNSEKIHIRGNTGWIDFKNAGNCTGSGNYSNPYIIKDLVIDGGNSGSCILIENSDVYFTIQNCTLFNSGHSGSRDSGIYLKNVSNGKILNNNCSFNKNGIYTYFSKNNTISANIARNNTYNGICVAARSNKTILDGNTACFNSYIGIHIDGGYTYHNSYNNLIINNNASYNAAAGIRITFTNDSKIINNTVINNGVSPWGANALNIQLCQNITISMNKLEGSNSEGVYAYYLNMINFYNNTISSNRGSGINFEYVRGLNIVDNYFADNIYGILLNGIYYNGEYQGVENCIISDNIFTDCLYGGIVIGEVFNLTIIENEFNYCGISIQGRASVYHATSHTIGISNLVNGKPLYYYVNQTNLEINYDSNIGQILLVNCNQSTLSNLIISSGSVGISLLYSNDNTISACTLNHHTWGLNIALSHSNTISGVTLNYNMFGIQLYNSNFTIIKENRVLSNHYGMLLYESHNNQIFRNYINNNLGFGIYLYHTSSFNLIRANTLNSNDIGISLIGHGIMSASNNNTIIDNTLLGNRQCFFEGDDCSGNIFENNLCVEGPVILGYEMFSLFFVLLLISSIMIKKVRETFS